MPTQDQLLADQIQSQYGSAKFGQLQGLRYVFYSKQTYPQAGTTSLDFFGDVVGQNGIGKESTNMVRSKSFSQRMFLLRAIRCQFFVASANIQAATIAATDLGIKNSVINSASYSVFSIQDKEYNTIAQPLAYMPFASGFTTSAVAAFAGSTATPCLGHGDVGSRKDDAYVLDPPQLIEAEVVFNFTINFATAVALPAGITGTVGVYFDGILFRPVQ